MDNIVIVGAGVSGLSLALFLAKKGHKIDLYDKRNVLDSQKDGRSINFTLSGRGMAVLKALGLSDVVSEKAAVLSGRTLHLSSKKITYRYGTKAQGLLSIRRSILIDILFNAMQSEPGIFFHPGVELQDIDESTSTCHFFDHHTQNTLLKKYKTVIGADGLFSNVRSALLKKQLVSYQQTVFDWGYKEYQFDADEAAQLQLSTDHMHMWPKSNALLVAIPNKDHTFSVIFTAPIRDKEGHFQEFNQLVEKEFPGIVCNAPSFLKQSGDYAFHHLMSIKVDQWHSHDHIMLIGDACHATYPFYGQGMNSALEDAFLLSEKLSNTVLPRHALFKDYALNRKKDADALHALSEGHLHHMTKAMLSPFWRACQTIDYGLTKIFPQKWLYEYEMVAHSSVRYSIVSDLLKKQHRKKLLLGFYLMASLLSFFFFLGDFF